MPSVSKCLTRAASSSLEAASSSLPIRRERKIRPQPVLPAKVNKPVSRIGIEFDHTPESSELFELYFLRLMKSCMKNKGLAFTTETQHLPFIGRTLGQQKIRHEDKLRAAPSEFHLYKLRHRYNLWEVLAKRQQIRILLDTPTLQSYFAFRTHSPLLNPPQEYFDELERYVQACRLLMLGRDFPGLLRLSETPITDSVLNAGDCELSYFNRLPSAVMRPRPADRKGFIKRIGVVGQNRIQARWDEAKNSSAAEQLLVTARETLRDDLLKAHRSKASDDLAAVFENRLGLGRFRNVASQWAAGSNHCYQDATLGSDGLQCWIVCDGVTPTHPATGEYEAFRSGDVKKFVDQLCLHLLGIVAEGTHNPISIVDCVKRANSWVREYNQANGFKYDVSGRPTPFAATAMIAMADTSGVRWASLGDCLIATPWKAGWRQLNRHQTEDVPAAIEEGGCRTLKERVQVVAQLRSHETYRIGKHTFRGFGVLNGDEQATEMIDFGTSDARLLVLGSDGIRSALLDNGKTLPRLPTKPDPTAIKTWFESTDVSASSPDDKTLLMLEHWS
jgi:hypothetical protein